MLMFCCVICVVGKTVCFRVFLQIWKIWTLDRHSLKAEVWYRCSESPEWRCVLQGFHLRILDFLKSSRCGLSEVFFNDVFFNQAFSLKALIYSALELAGGAAAAGVFTVTHHALWLIPVQVHPT